MRDVPAGAAEQNLYCGLYFLELLPFCRQRGDQLGYLFQRICQEVTNPCPFGSFHCCSRLASLTF